MIDFNKDDVITVAKALIEGGLSFEFAGDSYSDFDGYECLHCEACKQESCKDFKHQNNCPVLVAQDLLTGHED